MRRGMYVAQYLFYDTKISASQDYIQKDRGARIWLPETTTEHCEPRS